MHQVLLRQTRLHARAVLQPSRKAVEDFNGYAPLFMPERNIDIRVIVGDSWLLPEEKA